ncbi:MAG: hypothetical protein WCD12_15740 [Candidatus Binatus sp.]|jgi:hypothetical protein|uniref:hypothetical protein n=1 Tax=Candidatus Binatus sp. TaxID=2811406 RepID=UPI003C7761B0
MLRIGNRRQEIYDYFHNNEACQQFFFDAAQEERYAAYYTSMYLVQDTSESLLVHRARGFSSDPHAAYIEFWGVMQALIIQQDSISELYKAVTAGQLDIRALSSWQTVRTLRNACAGHPAKKDRPKNSPVTRTFMGRRFGGYPAITYEQWQAQKGITHPTVKLDALIDGYAKEAAAKLLEVLQSMKEQWPASTKQKCER